MRNTVRLMRGLTLLGAALAALKLCSIAWAGQQLEYPPPQPTGFVPNTAGHHGYFRTTWRQWPGEDHPEQDNPRAIGAKVIPTPEGQEEVPLPKAVAPPTGPGVKPPPQPPEGGILPPEGGILPPEGFKIPGTPETPAEPNTEKKPNSPIEGGLPGLPVEPDQSPLPLPSGVEKPTSTPKEKPKAEETPRSNDKGNSPSTNKMPSSAARLSQGTVVSLAGNVQPEDYALPGDSNRTSSIAAESQAGAVEPVAYGMAESAAPPGEAVAMNVPPVALGGYCPVELTQNGRWVRGDVRFTVVHNGHIYRLSGPAQRQQFLADPDALTPVNSGQDPVLAVDEHRMVPGEAAYCATYNGRLYMFSSAATQAKFNRIPQRYAVR